VPDGPLGSATERQYDQEPMARPLAQETPGWIAHAFTWSVTPSALSKKGEGRRVHVKA